MKQIDQTALELALGTILKGKDIGRAEQVRYLRDQDGWEPTARFCASMLQRQQLELKPWDRPPCDLDAPDDSAAGRLLRRMLGAGLSRYDPNPLRGLE
jgi:hypothetical protein